MRCCDPRRLTDASIIPGGYNVSRFFPLRKGLGNSQIGELGD
jgi:hypothetical protein